MDHERQIYSFTTVRDGRVVTEYGWRCSCGADSGLVYTTWNGARYGHTKHAEAVT